MISVFVIVEHGGHGGAAAAPIAGEIFKKYFIQKGMIQPEIENDETIELKKLQRARLGTRNDS